MTDVTFRTVPVAVTRIDYDMIWPPGARRLTELFDIYVPNTQIVKFPWSFEYLTPRGLEEKGHASLTSDQGGA